MKYLFRVVHAAHCKSTHHKLAMDALRYLKGSETEDWQRVFLKYHEEYLTGAKDPDTKFKDFRNHVLHVEDNNWGGAMKATRKWYDTTVEALRQGEWRNAVYSFGVMSHYYTDPLMPFHTGQKEREGNIHRAAEWSVTKSYEDLRDLGDLVLYHPDVPTNTGDDWLEQMVLQGAQYSHTFYDTFLDHYDFNRGVKKPKEGLDATCKEFLSKLLGHAAIGTARILERAIAESGAVAPWVSLSLETVFSTVQVPFRFIAKHIEDAEERSVIEAIYDEWQQTGKVILNLSEDDRMIEELHASEVEHKANQSHSKKTQFSPQNHFATRTTSTQSASTTSTPQAQQKSSWKSSKFVRDDQSHQTKSQHVIPPGQSKKQAVAEPITNWAESQMNSIDTETSHLLNKIESIESDLADYDKKHSSGSNSSESKNIKLSKESKQAGMTDQDYHSEIKSLYETTQKFDSDVKDISDLDDDQSTNSSSNSTRSSSNNNSSSSSSNRHSSSRTSDYDRDSSRNRDSNRSNRESRSSRDNDYDRESRSSNRSSRSSNRSSRDNDYDYENDSNRSSNRSRSSNRERNSERNSNRNRSSSSGSNSQSYERKTSSKSSSSSSRELRYYLKTTDDVEDAPSIGPKTAKRLKRVGVRTVTDLLNANPEETAKKINMRHIRPDTIRDWADQARLICCIPEVRGHDVQILVACGFRDVTDVANADDNQMLHLVNQFIETSEGQRVVRSGKLPDLDEIQDWILWAGEARTINRAA